MADAVGTVRASGWVSQVGAVNLGKRQNGRFYSRLAGQLAMKGRNKSARWVLSFGSTMGENGRCLRFGNRGERFYPLARGESRLEPPA